MRISSVVKLIGLSTKTRHTVMQNRRALCGSIQEIQVIGSLITVTPSRFMYDNKGGFLHYVSVQNNGRI